MADVSFDDLYSDDKNTALGIFLLWTNDFLDGCGAANISLDTDQAFSFVSNLRKEDFPANGGYDSASPFKKAANIFVWLQALTPFKSALSFTNSEGKQVHLPAAPAVGYHLVKSCLHGANLKLDGQAKTLENPIMVSEHFFRDLAEATDGAVPAAHFKVISLLFESLVYQTNDVSYPKVV